MDEDDRQENGEAVAEDETGDAFDRGRPEVFSEYWRFLEERGEGGKRAGCHELLNVEQEDDQMPGEQNREAAKDRQKPGHFF